MQKAVNWFENVWFGRKKTWSGERFAGIRGFKVQTVPIGVPKKVNKQIYLLGLPYEVTGQEMPPQRRVLGGYFTRASLIRHPN